MPGYRVIHVDGSVVRPEGIPEARMAKIMGGEAARLYKI